MNVEKMRHQVERNQDNYQWRYLATRPQTALFPSLQRLAETMAQIRTVKVRELDPPPL